MTVENSAETSQSKSFIPRKYVIGGVILLLVLALLTIGVSIFIASRFSVTLDQIVDLFIIALALEACVFGIVLILMLLMVIRLVNTVEFEVKPILEKTQDTIGMVRGTTQFMGDNVVKPSIAATSYIAAARRGLQVLFGDPKKNIE